MLPILPPYLNLASITPSYTKLHFILEGENKDDFPFITP